MELEPWRVRVSRHHLWILTSVISEIGKARVETPVMEFKTQWPDDINGPFVFQILRIGTLHICLSVKRIASSTNYSDYEAYFIAVFSFL